MLCPKCQSKQSDDNTECLRCGIIFAKYRPAARPADRVEPDAIEETDQASIGFSVKALLFEVDPDTNPLSLGGRGLLFLVLLIWGWRYAFSSVANSNEIGMFFHFVNLPFHEAGHLFFQIFGRFMTSLGGTLGQLLMPLFCLGILLLLKRDAYGASVCLWWFGQNFVDMAPYINDARCLSLRLLGGNIGYESPYGFHDWEYIFTETGLLRYDHVLAGIAHKAGILLIGLALVWGGFILFRQYKNLEL